MDSEALGFRALEHPAGRAEVGEGSQAVVEQRGGAGESQDAGDVDDVNVGEFLGQTFELQIGVSETIAMAMWPAVSEA